MTAEQLDADAVPEPPEDYYDAWTTSEWHHDGDVDELLDQADEVPA